MEDQNQTDEFVKLVREKVTSLMYIDKEIFEDWEVEVSSGFMANSIVTRFNALLTTQLLDEYTISYPCNWKEAFKERWFPQWWLKRYPVKYKIKTIIAKAIYPHIAFPEKTHYVHVVRKESITNKKGE